ncbi:hypothetical protein KIW84_055558 [Lathyrus oleraceus]|uniref:Uncharacterized protein n=1 Tax=Pisum sativum TaxID=3888 RepID=A0A9D4X0T7_PEA|nr:hypothetical protein KIW84_055558 [Pisum sativum]
MASFGSFSANILMAVMIVDMFCVTYLYVAQDSEIAPTGQLEAGDGFALPVSKMVLCSSVLVSLVAFMFKRRRIWIGGGGVAFGLEAAVKTQFCWALKLQDDAEAKEKPHYG